MYKRQAHVYRDGDDRTVSGRSIFRVRYVVHDLFAFSAFGFNDGDSLLYPLFFGSDHKSCVSLAHKAACGGQLGDAEVIQGQFLGDIYTCLLYTSRCV